MNIYTAFIIWLTSNRTLKRPLCSKMLHPPLPPCSVAHYIQENGAHPGITLTPAAQDKPQRKERRGQMMAPSNCGKSSEWIGELCAFPQRKITLNCRWRNIDFALRILMECCNLHKQAKPLCSDGWIDRRAGGYTFRPARQNISHLRYTRTRWAHGLPVRF